MKGVYVAQCKISSLSAAKTLMYITAPAALCVEILGASVTNASNETNEQIEVTLQRIGTLGTPTATTLTPSKTEFGDQAAQSTVKGNVTASEPTYSANTLQGYEGVASLGGYRYDPIPEERMYLKPGESVGLQILNSPTAFDAIVQMKFREIA